MRVENPTPAPSGHATTERLRAGGRFRNRTSGPAQSDRTVAAPSIWLAPPLHVPPLYSMFMSVSSGSRSDTARLPPTLRNSSILRHIRTHRRVPVIVPKAFEFKLQTTAAVPRPLRRISWAVPVTNLLRIPDYRNPQLTIYSTPFTSCASSGSSHGIVSITTSDGSRWAATSNCDSEPCPSTPPVPVMTPSASSCSNACVASLPSQKPGFIKVIPTALPLTSSLQLSRTTVSILPSTC